MRGSVPKIRTDKDSGKEWNKPLWDRRRCIPKSCERGRDADGLDHMMTPSAIREASTVAQDPMATAPLQDQCMHRRGHTTQTKTILAEMKKTNQHAAP